MGRRNTLVLLLAAVWPAAAYTVSAETSSAPRPASSSDAAALVRDLGDANWDVRDAASAALRELGWELLWKLPAGESNRLPPLPVEYLGPLRKAAEGNDVEAALRARVLLETFEDSDAAVAEWALEECRRWAALCKGAAGEWSLDPRIFSVWSGRAPKLVLRVGLQRGGRDFESWANAVAAKWAQVDPEAAAVELGRLNDPQARDLALKTVTYFWSMKDPRAAARLGESIQTSHWRSSSLWWAAARLADVDANAVLDMAERMASDGADLVHRLFQLAAERAPQSAAARAEKIKEVGLKAAVMETVAKEWGTHDVQAALAWIGDMKYPSNPHVSGPRDNRPVRNWILRELAVRWGAKDPAVAADLARQFQETYPGERDHVFREAAAEGGRVDANFGLAIAKRISDANTRKGAIAMAVGAWAGVGNDPQGAAKYAGGLPDAGERTAAIHAALYALAKRDPNAARELAETITDPGGRDWGIRLVVWGNPWHDTGPAFSLIDTIREANWRREATWAVATQWALKDPAAALEWARTSPEKQAWQWAAGAILGNLNRRARDGNLAEREYEDALCLAETMGPNGHLPPDYWLQTVVWAGCEKFPAMAADRLPSLGRFRMRQALCQTIGTHWGRKDMTAARKWAEALDWPPDRAAAMSGLAEAWAAKDPLAARRWAVSYEGNALEKARILEGIAIGALSR